MRILNFEDEKNSSMPICEMNWSSQSFQVTQLEFFYNNILAIDLGQFKN
jgi:hypothetical protein